MSSFPHDNAANTATVTPKHQALSSGHYNDQLCKDHFVTVDGEVFAGTHLILDLYGAKQLDQLDLMEEAIRQAASVAGATLLHIHLHHFTPNHGISGVAVLAESHISVHTWPERQFAAFDIFMCGRAQPNKAVYVLEQTFMPKRSCLEEIRRGKINHEMV